METPADASTLVDDSPKSTIIVGAGLAGSLQALYFARRGWSVDVYDKREDFRLSSQYEGRSINLALSERGRKALRFVDMEDDIAACGLPMKSRLIHKLNGTLDEQPYSHVEGEHVLSIGRELINRKLVDAAEAAGVRFHWGTGVSRFSFRTKEVHLVDTKWDKVGKASADLVVGADGAYSAVRRSMQNNGRMRFNYSQQYIPHSYKELCIPPTQGPDGKPTWALRNDVLHIWPRGTFMLIALPNPTHDFTVTLFAPCTTFDQLTTTEALDAFFGDNFADAAAVMPELHADFFERNPTGNLMTVRCAPYHWEDGLVLIGDAAHAVVPFYGQGMNASLQDVYELEQCLQAHPNDRALALQRYSVLRKPAADALAHLSLSNYVEMRDSVNHSSHVLRKQLDALMNRLLGDAWVPLYRMVAFTDIPYHKVVLKAKEQDRVVSRVKKVALAAGVLGLGYLFVRSKI